jgi:hypothetical protein
MRLLALLMTACTAAAALAACSKGGGKEVLLEAAADRGPDAFATTIKHVAPPTTVQAAVPTTAVSGGTVRRASGTAPGLYGGTQNIGSCDVDQMVEFLAKNADKAAAWAASQGIAVGDLGDYLKGLTPVVLRVDTRVTNNGFAGGKATPRQAVLQAGTAVLIDAKGVPRAKCACGNPLQPPVTGDATYSGTKWPGFSAAAVVAVSPGPVEVDRFTLTDPKGTQFTRPVGGNGTSDASAAAAPAGGYRDDLVFTGTGDGTMPAFDMDVPFAIAGNAAVSRDLYEIVPNNYGSGEVTAKLEPPGHYEHLQVDVTPDGSPWKVVVHPAGPLAKQFSGRGDTTVGTFQYPALVLVDLRATPDAGNLYIHASYGLIAAFTVTEGENLADLEMADHKNTGWTLNVWTAPKGCQPKNRTESSVTCAL